MINYSFRITSAHLQYLISKIFNKSKYLNMKTTWGLNINFNNRIFISLSIYIAKKANSKLK